MLQNIISKRRSTVRKVELFDVPREVFVPKRVQKWSVSSVALFTETGRTPRHVDAVSAQRVHAVRRPRNARYRYVTCAITQSNSLRDTQYFGLANAGTQHACKQVHACARVRTVAARAKGHDQARFFSLESPRPPRVAIL